MTRMADDDQRSDDERLDPETAPSSSERGALVPVAVKGLILDPSSNVPIVILRESAGERFLPIWIGDFEAHAIACALEGIESPRPMSHDLMATIVESLAGHLARVVVSDLDSGTFFAQVHLETEDGGAIEIDARPSDGIALALRLNAELFVVDHVFALARDLEQTSRLTDEEKIRKWLEDVDPDDLGKYTM